MMHTFLENHRVELIERCREKTELRQTYSGTPEQLIHGVPLFLDQLIKTLLIEQGSSPLDSREVSGPAGGAMTMSEVGTTAAQHGSELLALGYTISEVVHTYGDLCQAITDLSVERKIPFESDEFRTFNRCLDNAIAEAVTEFSYQRDTAIEATHLEEANKHAGMFIHEMRNALQMATFAFDAAKGEKLGLSGATGSVLERSLARLDHLIQQAVTEIRETSGQSLPSKLFSAAELIDEIAQAGALLAQAKQCTFTVAHVDKMLAISGNRSSLYIAVSNLVQNAFKFTRPCTEVTIDTYAVADRILIDVADRCGGLPKGSIERMFHPFAQTGSDKSGLGLGLTISHDAVDAAGGVLSALDVPGHGCVFTISLPRYKAKTRGTTEK
ncbi:sensor histidine kinase [Caballeronia sp. M23-90]